MTINTNTGAVQMPRQEVADGQKHGYIGEDTGEVEVIDAKEPGYTNVTPDLPTAEARVKAAERELAAAQKSLGQAKIAARNKTNETPKAPVGATTTPAAPAPARTGSQAGVDTTPAKPSAPSSSEEPPSSPKQ